MFPFVLPAHLSAVNLGQLPALLSRGALLIGGRHQAQNLRDTICPLCNESKNDKLASTEQLQRLVKRNEEIISTQKSGSILINTNEYDNTTLMRFYHIAKMNGFELWEEGNSK